MSIVRVGAPALVGAVLLYAGIQLLLTATRYTLPAEIGRAHV